MTRLTRHALREHNAKYRTSPSATIPERSLDEIDVASTELQSLWEAYENDTEMLRMTEGPQVPVNDRAGTSVRPPSLPCARLPVSFGYIQDGPELKQLVNSSDYMICATSNHVFEDPKYGIIILQSGEEEHVLTRLKEIFSSPPSTYHRTPRAMDPTTRGGTRKCFLRRSARLQQKRAAQKRSS
jgi:hypothetical protein